MVLDGIPYLQKDEVVYVGDAPSDILACQEVGIPIVAAAWAETAEVDKLMALDPDFTFFDVNAFHEWLLQRI